MFFLIKVEYVGVLLYFSVVNMDVLAVLKWKIVLILFIYRVYMSTLGSESIAASCDHHHVVRRVSQDDVLETSSECAAKTWSQLLQPCFQIYHGISQIRGRFLWSKLRFTSSGRPGERETSTEAGIKEAKKSRVNGFATCTLAFHNPLCVTAVMTPYRRAFPAALPFWKVTESLRKTASFFSTRPTSKTSKLLRLQAPPRAPTDRPSEDHSTSTPSLTLAEVSNQPRKPVSLQKLSMSALLLKLSFFWSHLLASSTDGMGLPLASFTLLSRSCFHLDTASKVEPLVTSNTTKAPTASL